MSVMVRWLLQAGVVTGGSAGSSGGLCVSKEAPEGVWEVQ